MTNEQRARELATKLQDCVDAVLLDSGLERMVMDNHGIELLKAAFAEVARETTAATLDEAARVVEAGQETYSADSGASLSPRYKDNVAGLVYATAIRALSEPAAPDPTKALARFFREWFECGTPNAIAIKCGLVQVADRANQLELTDLGRAALTLAGAGG